MKRITLSVDEGILRQARRRASAEHRTLNDVLRQWLEQYVSQSASSGTSDAPILPYQEDDHGRTPFAKRKLVPGFAELPRIAGDCTEDISRDRERC